MEKIKEFINVYNKGEYINWDNFFNRNYEDYTPKEVKDAIEQLHNEGLLDKVYKSHCPICGSTGFTYNSEEEVDDEDIFDCFDCGFETDIHSVVFPQYKKA